MAQGWGLEGFQGCQALQGKNYLNEMEVTNVNLSSGQKPEVYRSCFESRHRNTDSISAPPQAPVTTPVVFELPDCFCSITISHILSELLNMNFPNYDF